MAVSGREARMPSMKRRNFLAIPVKTLPWRKASLVKKTASQSPMKGEPPLVSMIWRRVLTLKLLQ